VEISSPCSTAPLGGLSGMAYSTTANVRCGQYKYTIDSNLRECSIDPSFLGRNKMVAWDVESAKKAIHDFCTDDAQKYGYLVDPATPQPPNTFSQDRGSYPYQSYRYGPSKTDHVIDIFVALAKILLVIATRRRLLRLAIIAIGALSR